MSRLSPDVLKAALPAAAYYPTVLPTLPAPKRAGWINGGLCPFHADQHTGNFRIHWETGAFTCFACGAKGGDIIAFHQTLHGLEFKDAIDDLAVRYLARRTP
ncbi:MAG: CHC2 zinc finger domain-containing protein [Candidatus Competibacteraceae bacterium]|jgi:hypothetical protein|nr:CHC2 zinc finger domain-containing protein [Candidatus Competibacteraceae bacterium]